MLFCSGSGLPCRFPVVCTVCGAVYEESVAKKRIADKINCVSGHVLLPEAFIPLRNGPVHSEESLEEVRVSTLSGVLDYFGSLVSSLASDNYALRKQLAQSCLSDNSNSTLTQQAAITHQNDPNTTNSSITTATSSSVKVLEQIQRYTPQLVAIRATLPLPPIVQSSPESLKELCGRLKNHLKISQNPIFNLFSTMQQQSICIESEYIWPIYQAPHANSDRVSISFIAVSSRLYIEVGETRLPIDGTVLVFIQSNYIYSVQDHTLALQDMLPFINLDLPPRVITTRHELSHTHPYGLCIYTRHQGMLTLIPTVLDNLGYLTDISLSVSASTICLSQTQQDAPALDLAYEGDFLKIHPDGRLLLTYLPDQSTLLLSDICQLPYKLGSLLQHHVDGIHPIKADWDGTGKQITLLGRDGESIQMRLEKGVLLRSK